MLYNETILSHTKEQSWVISVETWMGLETVLVQTEGSQKEKQISYINTFMEPEKIGRQPYLQSRNTNRCREKMRMDAKEERE